MKTITRNTISVLLLEDNKHVEIKDDFTVVGNPPEFYISDCKSNNAKVFENVEAPSDWFNERYIYDNSKWELNPNRVEPIIMPEPTPVLEQPKTTGLEEI